jgi:hypothetical protein
MNEAASSVEPKDKTRFATVDDAAFEKPQFPVFNNCNFTFREGGAMFFSEQKLRSQILHGVK